MQSEEDKEKEQNTQYLYIGSFAKTSYVKFLINSLSFTKQTNVTKYKQMFLGLIAISS